MERPAKVQRCSLCFDFDDLVENHVRVASAKSRSSWEELWTRAVEVGTWAKIRVRKNVCSAVRTSVLHTWCKHVHLSLVQSVNTNSVYILIYLLQTCDSLSIITMGFPRCLSATNPTNVQPLVRVWLQHVASSSGMFAFWLLIQHLDR